MPKALVIGQPMTPEVLRILEDFSITHARFIHEQEIPDNLGLQLARRGKGFRLCILNRTKLQEKLRLQVYHFAQKAGIDILEFGPQVTRRMV